MPGKIGAITPDTNSWDGGGGVRIAKNKGYCQQLHLHNRSGNKSHFHFALGSWPHPYTAGYETQTRWRIFLLSAAVTSEMPCSAFLNERNGGPVAPQIYSKMFKPLILSAEQPNRLWDHMRSVPQSNST